VTSEEPQGRHGRSVIICTADRANDLRDTLASLAEVQPAGRVELLVVDNRSTDHTRQVVEEASRHHPFAVRYLFEGEAGKYAALNAGIKASTGRIIAATDDDARFETDWLERAVDGLSRYGCEFVGGRVDPVWGGPKPAWLLENNGLHAKVIALLDHGDRVREFGRGISWPLGVNVAYRRDVSSASACSTTGSAARPGTLRNQAQREWHLRARAAGHGASTCLGWSSSPRGARTSAEAVLPPLVVLARHQPRDVVPSERL